MTKKAQRQVEDWFEEHQYEEMSKFDRIMYKVANRPSVQALWILDLLEPGTQSFMAVYHSRSTDSEYVSVKLSSKAFRNMTEAHVIDLLRCGIYYDGEKWDGWI